MSLNVSVAIADFLFETGKQLMGVEVSLGSAEKSSTCKITLSDPFHDIAAALINHSLKEGGIKGLESEKANTQPATTAPVAGSVKADLTGGTVAKGDQFSAKTRAFLDTVCKRETNRPNDASLSGGYYQNNGISGSTGQFTEADIKLGGGFPASAGTKFNVGRYQFNRGDWSDAVKAGYLKPGYAPLDQDAVALWKLQKAGRGWKELQAGDIEAALKKAGGEWASIPGSPYGQVQPGTTKQEYLDYYAARLAFYQGSTVPQATKVPATAVPPLKPDATDTGKPVIKGSILSVNIEGFQFDYYHQGTETSEAGITVLLGQGVRWLLSRRKRNRTLKALSLKQLAQLVAKDHKVKLDYQAAVEPDYDHIDQSGISDYQLLLRECDQNGLMVTEVKGVLTIKERAQLGQPVLVLKRGVNLIGYKIVDKALGTHEDEISKLLPQTAKTVIDPVTGTANPQVKDTQRSASTNSVTGKAKPATGGSLKTGVTEANIEKAKTKRVAGLPSTFVIPLSLESLPLTPLTTCLTDGFPEILNRIWVIKTITHDVAVNTTTLQLVSPVEVKDTDPVSAPTAQQPGVDTGKWIYPCTGKISSPFGRRVPPVPGASEWHKGSDIANISGTPIYAAMAGTVTFNAYDTEGGGNFIRIKHKNGYSTKYLHLRDPAILTVGTQVTQGQQVGIMGHTGRQSGDHCHFSVVDINGEAVNPHKIFPKLEKRGTQITALETAT